MNARKTLTKVLTIKCAACCKEYSMVWDPLYERSITDQTTRVGAEHLLECKGPINRAFDEVLA